MKERTKTLLILLCATCAYTARVPRHHDGRIVTDNKKALPVVMWHGMGDSCCASYSIGKIKNLIEDQLGELKGMLFGGLSPGPNI